MGMKSYIKERVIMVEEKTYPVSESDLLNFVNYAERYATRFGLQQYTINYFFDDLSDEGYLAMCATALDISRNINITLSKTWHIPVTEEQLELTAFHEVMHALFFTIRKPFLMESRTLSREDRHQLSIDAEHGIIAILEKEILDTTAQIHRSSGEEEEENS